MVLINDPYFYGTDFTNIFGKCINLASGFFIADQLFLHLLLLYLSRILMAYFLPLIISKRGDVWHLNREFFRQITLAKFPSPGLAAALLSATPAWHERSGNKIQNFLNFCSSHLIPKPPRTLWNGPWKIYGWFWKQQQRGEGPGNEAELGVWREHELPWFVQHTNLTLWNRISKALKAFQREASSVYPENNELLTKCNLAEKLSKDEFRKP